MIVDVKIKKQALFWWENLKRKPKFEGKTRSRHRTRCVEN